MEIPESLPSIGEDSPSVHAHLNILQGVIARMAANSASCKTWCITVVSAILVLVAEKGKPEFAFLALVPMVLFLLLDVYYLALEKGFRAAYLQFVEKLHSRAATSKDLYSIARVGEGHALWEESLKSFSVWGFYSAVIILVVLAGYLVLA